MGLIGTRRYRESGGITEEFQPTLGIEMSIPNSIIVETRLHLRSFIINFRGISLSASAMETRLSSEGV